MNLTFPSSILVYRTLGGKKNLHPVQKRKLLKKLSKRRKKRRQRRRESLNSIFPSLTLICLRSKERKKLHRLLHLPPLQRKRKGVILKTNTKKRKVRRVIQCLNFLR